MVLQIIEDYFIDLFLLLSRVAYIRTDNCVFEINKIVHNSLCSGDTHDSCRNRAQNVGISHF